MRSKRPRATPRRARSTLLPALVLIVAGIAAYSSSFEGAFVYDDEPSIVDNPNVRSLWPLTRAMAAPRDTTVAGRPIASLTFALNHALAPDLWGHHAVNLAIHLLAALALFGIVRRTLTSERMRERFGDAAVPLAFVTALVWVVHPLQTGSVTYIVQRVESLMGLFYLLTLYCAIRASQTPEPWTVGAIVACALGMGSKEVMVTAPLMIVLWDWIFLTDQPIRNQQSAISNPQSVWSRRWPLYTGLAATWVILAVLVAGGPRTRSVGFGFAAWPWRTYLTTQAGVVAHYLRLSIVPSPLVFDDEWQAARSLADVAPQAMVLITLVGLTIWALARRLPVGFAGAWLFGILAPTSSVVPIVTEIAAEHRMYLPLAAIVASAVVAVYAWWPPRFPRAVLGFAAAALAVAFGYLTDARNRDYESGERLWLDTVQKRPESARPRTNYATFLIRRGQYREAEEHLRVAVRVKPESAEAQADLGVALCGRGACDEGIGHLQQALVIEPGYPAAHQDLGEAFASQGKLGLAVTNYLAALERRPEDVTLLNRAAWVLATAADDGVRNGVRAVALAERAARLTGRGDVISLDSLAAAYAEVGRFLDAVVTCREALALARAKGDHAIAPELEARLALYVSNRTFHQ